METLDFDVLISYHKQEASEEMAYITIIFTVILGLLGYLGTAKRITKAARVIIAITFSSFYFVFNKALFNSLEIHRAIHIEIKNHVQLHPENFIGGKKSVLYHALIKHMEPQESNSIIIWAILLGLVLLIGILTIGQNGIFSLNRKRNQE